MSMLMIGVILAVLLAVGLLAILLLRQLLREQPADRPAGVRLGATVPPVVTAALPDMVGGYRIERLLGRGAMGAVYLAHEAQTGQAVALKTIALAPEFAPAFLTEVKTRFLREAEAVARLRHTAIIQTLAAGEDGHLAWMAMEFFPGRPLSDWTAPDQLLPLPQVLALVRQIALALDHAHGRQVVHRDIKPANILYDPQTGRVKLTDFGVARLTDASRTLTGMVLGTPAFMSPEQLAGEHIDGRSDLYSLGAVLFQLSTGHLPFSGQSLAELMQAIQSQPVQDPRILQPRLPAALARIIMKALQKTVTERFQTGAQFALALARLEASQKRKDPHA